MERISVKSLLILLIFILAGCPSFHYTFKYGGLTTPEQIKKQEQTLLKQKDLEKLGFHYLVFEKNIKKAIEIFKKGVLQKKFREKSLLGLTLCYDMMFNEVETVRYALSYLKTENRTPLFTTYALLKLFHFISVTKKSGENFYFLAKKEFDAGNLDYRVYALFNKDRFKNFKVKIEGPLSKFPYTDINRKNIGAFVRNPEISITVSANSRFINFLPQGLFKVTLDIDTTKKYVLVIKSQNPVSLVYSGQKTVLFSSSVKDDRYRLIFLNIKNGDLKKPYLLIAKKFYDPEFELSLVPAKSIRKTVFECENSKNSIINYVCFEIGMFIEQNQILANIKDPFPPVEVLKIFYEFQKSKSHFHKKWFARKIIPLVLKMPQLGLAYYVLSEIKSTYLESPSLLRDISTGEKISGGSFYFRYKKAKLYELNEIPLPENLKGLKDYQKPVFVPVSHNLNGKIVPGLVKFAIQNSYYTFFDLVKKGEIRFDINRIKKLLKQLKDRSIEYLNLFLMLGNNGFFEKFRTSLNEILRISKKIYQKGQIATFLLKEVVLHKKYVYVHEAIKLENSEGVRRFGEWKFGEGILFLKFRCIKTNLEIVYPETLGNSEYELFSFPNLEVGDIIEIEYVFDANDILDKFSYFIFNFQEDKIPVLKGCLYVEKGFPYLLNQKKIWLFENQKKGYVALCSKNIPPFDSEQDAFHPEFLKEGVIVFFNQKGMFKRFLEKIKVYSRISRKILDKIKTVVNLQKPEESVVKSIAEFVIKHVEKNNTYLFSDHVDEIYLEKQGSRTLLLYSLLKNLGYNPVIVMVRPKRNQAPSNIKFNIKDYSYPVLRLENGDFIDVNQTLKINGLMAELQNQPAYIVDENREKFVKIVTPEEETWRDDMKITVLCKKVCTFLIKGNGKYASLVSGSESSAYNFVSNYFKSFFPIKWIKLNKKIINKADFIIKGSFEIDFPAEIKTFDAGLLVPYFKLPKRQTPFFLPLDVKITQKIVICNAFAHPFKTIETKNDFIHLSVKLSREKNCVVIDELLNIIPRIVGAFEYNGLKKFVFSYVNIPSIGIYRR